MIERRDIELTDLKRRLSNQIIIGKIIEVDHKQARYRIKSGDIETDWIADTQARSGATKTWEGRDIGEQVILACPSGDLSQGIIIGALATDATKAGDQASLHRTMYPDGTTIDYDDEKNSYAINVSEGGSFALAIGGGASIKAVGGRLIFNAPEGIEFATKGNASLMSEGGLSINTSQGFSVQSSTLSHNGKNIGASHVHSGVKSGPSFTGQPQ